MLPSDSWDQGSSSWRSTSSPEDIRSDSASPISIDRLAVLLSPREGAPDELARDLHLHHIVEQACLATGATGAAIALARGDELICRASTGSTAPDLGVRLNTEHGLSAFCVHTREVQSCDDGEIDPRVDAEACRQLGVRSVLVVPMIYGDFLLGIFEIFSPHPFAFGDRDLKTVTALSRSVFIALGITSQAEEPQPQPAPETVAPPTSAPLNRLHFSDLLAAEQDQMERIAEPSLASVADRFREVPAKPKVVNAKAAEPPVARQEPPPAPSHPTPAPESYPQFNIAQPPPRDHWTAVLTFLVVAFALLLGWMLGHGRTARKNAAQEGLQAAVAAQQASSPQAAPTENSDPGEVIDFPSSPSPSPKKTTEKKPSPDSLVVYKDGKIIYRQENPPRSANQTKAETIANGAAASSPPVQLAPEIAGTLLTRRVEPHYPDRARRRNMQGAVILQALVNEDGGVQQLKVLVGNADLAIAAIDAVRHWRFKPYAPQGKASQFETRITVNFALPSTQQVND